MNSEDQRDQLIDMLLREVVGGETPPDVRERVLRAAVSLSAQPLRPRRRAPVRRYVAPRPAARSRAPFYAVAALFTALVVATGMIYVRGIASSRTPVVTHSSGSVNRDEGALRPGESVSTGAESQAELTYPDGTVIELAAETTLRIAAGSWNDRSKKLELVTGRIVAEVMPQAPDHPMVLSSEGADAEVVGTKLSLEHDENGTRLEVTEGAVRFIPSAGGAALLVQAGLFAEADKAGIRSGEINPRLRKGIVRFTLMNADSDEPLREAPLTDGDVLSLASLPTPNINIRADYEGEAPTSVRIRITREDGQPTGIRPFASDDQTKPPFFAAGDFWAEGRPNDCREWTPQPGHYRISADASYDVDRGKPLEMGFRITE